MKQHAVFLSSLLAGLPALSFGGSVVFDNGPLAFQTVYDMKLFVQADSFTLGSSATVTDLVFWNYEIRPDTLHPQPLRGH
jgi:hypothetical protein